MGNEFHTIRRSCSGVRGDRGRFPGVDAGAPGGVDGRSEDIVVCEPDIDGCKLVDVCFAASWCF